MAIIKKEMPFKVLDAEKIKDKSHLYIETGKDSVIVRYKCFLSKGFLAVGIVQIINTIIEDDLWNVRAILLEYTCGELTSFQIVDDVDEENLGGIEWRRK